MEAKGVDGLESQSSLGTVVRGTLGFFRRFGLRMVGWFFGTCLSLVLLYLLLALVLNELDFVTMEHKLFHGWARVASRTSAAMTVPFYAWFLLFPPSRYGLNMTGLITACSSHFIHIALVWVDVKPFDDSQVWADLMADRGDVGQLRHPLLSQIPWPVMCLLGGCAYLALAALVVEQIFKTIDRDRMTAFALCCSSYTTGMFLLFYVDRLIAETRNTTESQAVWYPLTFIAILVLASLVCLTRELPSRQRSNAPPLVSASRSKKDG